MYGIDGIVLIFLRSGGVVAVNLDVFSVHTRFG